MGSGPEVTLQGHPRSGGRAGGFGHDLELDEKEIAGPLSRISAILCPQPRSSMSQSTLYCWEQLVAPLSITILANDAPRRTAAACGRFGRVCEPSAGRVLSRTGAPHRYGRRLSVGLTFLIVRELLGDFISASPVRSRASLAAARQ